MKTRFSAVLEEAQNSDENESLVGQLRNDGLTAIQDYRLIKRAIDRGISKQEIADAQGICLLHLRHKIQRLRKISGEVANLFEDVWISLPTFDVLGKMTEKRQIEVANLMLAAGNYSCKYASALLAATGQRGLVKPKKLSGITPKQMAEMERETKALQRDMRQVEASYGNDMLSLAIATGYLAKLVSNSEIERYLEGKYPEVMEGVREVIAAASLG